MRNHSAYCRAVILLIAVAVCVPLKMAAATVDDRVPGRTVPIIGMGQAVLDPENNAKSQQQAIQDLMGQALIQAMAKYLTPTQIGTQFTAIQKKILARPQKYVGSYQVFSEKPDGGLYRVLGQVTISLDVLRKDLEESGFPVAPVASSEPASAMTDPAADTQAIPDSPDPGQNPSASRGLSVTKKEILWVVPEKWEQEWIIPTGKKDAQPLFSQGMMKELDKYNYTLHFPEPGSVKIDYTGNIPQVLVVALAQGLGIQDAVVGSVVLKQERNRPARLVMILRVLKVSEGKAEGEVTREIGMEELSNQEGAFELAAIIAPRLNNLLGGGSGGAAGTASASRGQTPSSQTGSGSPGTPSQWTISFPSIQFSYWKEMERVLREHFKSAQVSGLEMGADEGSVRLNGVDGGFISKLNGTPLPSGATVVIESYSTETQAVKVSFTPPGAKGEPQR